jgi:hypothetical protein
LASFSGASASEVAFPLGQAPDPLEPHVRRIDEADLADAASRLDAKQNAAAGDFGHDLGTIASNCTKTEVEAQTPFQAAVLPN